MIATERQRAAIDALIRFGSYRKAADWLGIAERTLKGHIYDARDANGCRSIVELVLLRDREVRMVA